MKIKQDPITKLWCREDGAILMPPVRHSRFKKFRWTFGTKQLSGYHTVWYRGKTYFVHQMVCRAFNGSAPEGRFEVDHISRIRDDNRSINLRWVTSKENKANRDCVDESVARYGVRSCCDKAAYAKAYIAAHREERNAHQRAYYERHREEVNARWAAKAAEMKAQGLAWGKGPDGKWGWHPRVHP